MPSYLLAVSRNTRNHSKSMHSWRWNCLKFPLKSTISSWKRATQSSWKTSIRRLCISMFLRLSWLSQQKTPKRTMRIIIALITLVWNRLIKWWVKTSSHLMWASCLHLSLVALTHNKPQTPMLPLSRALSSKRSQRTEVSPARSIHSAIAHPFSNPLRKCPCLSAWRTPSPTLLSSPSTLRLTTRLSRLSKVVAIQSSKST